MIRNSKSLRIIFILLLILLTSIKFFSPYSNARDSEQYVESMISAGTIGLKIPDQFGLIILESEGAVYSGTGGGNLPGSALWIAYHPQNFINNVNIYSSRMEQLGIQGWIAYYMSTICRQLHLSARICYHLYRYMNALILSTVIISICHELNKRYNALFSIVFYLVTILSVWMTDFSCNIYWITFSWFLPMLWGLMCLNNHQKRWIYYILIGLSIAFKSACGYEYISNVMLGAVLFTIIEFIISIKERRHDTGILFRTIVGISMSCLIGFFFVFFLNAYFRGNGNAIDGFKEIYEADIIRRTFGNADNYDAAFAPSLNASVISVLVRYFLLSITGLIATPTLIINIILMRKRKDKEAVFKDAILLVCSLITSISWFILAKSHSYAHHHLNGVLFYLPFMQVSIYLLIKQTIGIILIHHSKEQTVSFIQSISDYLFKITNANDPNVDQSP